MTLSLHGMGVSRGIAIGRVHIIERDRLDIPEYHIEKDQVETETRRLVEAVSLAKQQLRAIRDHIPAATSPDIAPFIDTHLLMLDDTVLTQEPLRLIKSAGHNAEWALQLQQDALMHVFDEMEDPYLRTRKDDIDHVVNRIQRILLKQKPLRHEEPDSRLNGYVLIADDLSPADTVLMQHHGILAFVTEYGGPTSHTAILARSLIIPAIVGLHEAGRFAREDDMVIVDGNAGVMLVDPDEHSLRYYRKRQQEDRKYYAGLIRLKETPAKTLNDVPIRLQANVELPQDFEIVRQVGASGVGLYRTEFLYMNRETPPEEEEHYETYLSVLDTMAGLPLTIRTMDLGADKQVDGGKQGGSVQANPALGLRAVRLCLKEPALFRPQLRAILRASAHGSIRLMIPMLSNMQETRQVLEMIDEIKAELNSQGVEFDTDIPVGAMIEVPAAAICADIFAGQLDFLSIGTNDLIQYTIAIDRVDDEVSYLYEPLHPAVLRLIRMTLDAGARADIPVAMCGEMAGDIKFTQLLLGLGLREFSVHPAYLLEVKKNILESELERLTGVADAALEASTAADVEKLLEQL
ncbi:MAG: phosphoenolpyruvate--protein phosphotransferase [Gammaproteobacteria bacterium]|nr:phosphoenolpyruvate--protein phosphotransferase [Gammaproteobacteria bacterium]